MPVTATRVTPRSKDRRRSSSIEPLPAQPKPTNAEEPTNFDARTNSEQRGDRACTARSKKPEATEPTAVAREAGGLVTTRPKPEKRKNAKERAKAKYAKDKTRQGRDHADDGKGEVRGG